MNREQFLKAFPNASAATLARNGFALARLEAPKREPDPKPALDGHAPTQLGSQGSLRIRVTIVAYLPNLFDGDNLVGGCKCLRDHISRTLGIDDGDPRIEWEYGQVRTQGTPGTSVKIEAF